MTAPSLCERCYAASSTTHYRITTPEQEHTRTNACARCLQAVLTAAAKGAGSEAMRHGGWQSMRDKAHARIAHLRKTGMSYGRIASRLLAEGYLNTRGTPYSLQSVMQVCLASGEVNPNPRTGAKAGRKPRV